MFNTEELEEIKRSINELIASRLKYRTIETNYERLRENEDYLTNDYKILSKIVRVLER